MSNGELTKVIVKSFVNKKVDSEDPEFKEFELPINPESYSRSLKVNYEKKKSQGSQGTNPKYKSTEPEEIKLEFTFDGTGTVEGYPQNLIGMKVSAQIKEFLNTVYYVKGKIHKPKFLKLSWGKHLVFDCLMTGCDINYTLFHNDGEPLRAKVSVTFLEYIEPKKRVKKQDNQSPDLTHLRMLKAGDTLPLVSYEIYSDKTLYMQVAKANRLTSFRNVKTGRELAFPPVEKTKE